MTVFFTFLLISMWALMTISPLIILLSILGFTSFSMILKWIEIGDSWIPLIFVLTFLGGLMVMFMYIVSSLPSKIKPVKMFNFFFIFMVGLMTLNGTKVSLNQSFSSLSLIQFSGHYMICTMVIMLTMLVCSKLIMSPFKSLKSAF